MANKENNTTPSEHQSIIETLNSMDPVQDTENTDTTTAVDIIGKARQEQKKKFTEEARKSYETTAKNKAEMERKRIKEEREAERMRKEELAEAEKAKQVRQINRAIKLACVICSSSAVLMFLVIGVVFKIFVNPSEIIFSIVVAAVALIVVSSHVFAFNYMKAQLAQVKIYKPGEVYK